jgi:hypothetical protein
VDRETVVGHELTAPRRETGVGLQRRRCQHGSAWPPLRAPGGYLVERR